MDDLPAIFVRIGRDLLLAYLASFQSWPLLTMSALGGISAKSVRTTLFLAPPIALFSVAYGVYRAGGRIEITVWIIAFTCTMQALASATIGVIAYLLKRLTV